jgi:adenylate cyclase
MSIAGERSERSIQLERKVVLAEALDALIEQCRRARLPLERALELLLPRACELIGARGALVRALDEQFERRAFRSGEFPTSWDAALPTRFESEPIPPEARVGGRDGAALLIMRPLDCADEVVGAAAFAFAPDLAPPDLERAREECRTAAEQLDNYLEAIAAAARKQRLSVDASAALRAPVLEDGADRAIELLSRTLGLELVALIYADVGARGQGTVHYRLYRDGVAVADSADHPDERLEAAIGREGLRILDPANHAAALAIGRGECVETALINGVVEAQPVGKLVVPFRCGTLGPESMDVLRLFAECLSQRLVDHNRERRSLCRSFAPSVVTALLRDPDYHRKHLVPRVAPTAILFSDISGFTAISEEVLGDPDAIGELIDLWAGEAADILHAHGGVFDKLVGDCVIGLFGPPFFRRSEPERIAAAVRAAVAISRMTRRLGAERGYDERIRARGIGPGLGTASGVNFGPTAVGLFGPNQDYTGFSSYMNNTARLQGMATWNEVLLMAGPAEVAREVLEGGGLRLAGPHEAKAKNVREPLRYFRVTAEG